MLYAALIALVAGGDQWLKYKVEAQDGETFPRPLEKAKGKIWIYRNHNEGFPFGFMEKHKELVRLVPLILTSILAGGLSGRKGVSWRKQLLLWLLAAH